MAISEGLKTSLNAIREISSEIYHQYVPIIDDDTDIGSFGAPILSTPVVMNEFISALVNRIVYTQFERKYFRNPLQVLEGDRIPLGYAGQEIFVNPAKGRKFNVDDFAGLLVKYEADVKVQYTAVNMDLQYRVTVSRHKLKQAFVSWDSLDTFIGELSNSLYNGAFIDEYQFSKELISGAYKSNQAQISVLDATGGLTENLAKEFVVKARELFLNFQTPSTSYNAWAKVGGEGKPVKTWTNPEDIVFLIRNDIRAFMDVNVLASAFNMDKADLLGNIITVDNFDQFDDDGNKIFDGSAIIGMIADKSWFRIKRQDMFLDEFYNANNRTWQYYLNLTKMYNYSLFANGVIFATALPEVNASAITVDKDEITVAKGATSKVVVTTTPFSANQTITVSSSAEGVATATISNKVITITGVDSGDGVDGTATITVTCGNLTDTISVTVPYVAST